MRVQAISLVAENTFTAMTSYKSINYDEPLPENLDDQFTVTCPPNTDVWEKPPSTHSFNAPIIYRSTTVASLKSAKVAVSADWKHLYDQGGLCLVINPESDHKQWVKTGIEYLEGQPRVSTVATDRWSDWSLRPMPAGDGSEVTIEMASENDGSLWVYLLEGEMRSPMREVTWWADVDRNAECWIGVYVAKPAKEQQHLSVRFDHLLIETT